MRHRWSLLAILFVCFLLKLTSSLFSSQKKVKETIINDKSVTKITRYEIGMSPSLAKELRGLNPGIGSSLVFKEKRGETYIFWMLTDRGPNFDGPATFGPGEVKVFPYPDYAPFIGEVEVVRGKSATLLNKVVMIGQEGILTGRPLPPRDSAWSYEVPASLSFKALEYDKEGIDPESLSYDKATHTFWVGEEYGPSLLQVDARNGCVLRRLSPGEGLPEIFQYRKANRGIEALDITPRGKVVLCFESPLEDKKALPCQAPLIRLCEVDPLSLNTRQFAYLYDEEVYENKNEAKIGDMTALSDDLFLLVEQGKTKEGEYRHVIYLVDISGAEDITHKKLPNGQELETASTDVLRSLLRPVRKQKILDVDTYGWPYRKLEGLAIVNDRFLVFSNDNDFGVQGENFNEQDNMPQRLSIDKEGKLHFNKAPRRKAFHTYATREKSELWVIELAKPLLELAR